MRLRTRILIGFAVLLAIVIGVATTVIATQRNQLIEQLDRRLESVVPLERPSPRPDPDMPPPGDDEPPREPDDTARVRPISDLYLAEFLADGSVLVAVDGQLLPTTPDLADLPTELPPERTFVTVDGVDGDIAFRALLDPSPATGRTLIVATPTTDVDETVDRLVITFAVVIVLIAAVLALLAFWIIRLGLRPVADVADTARAVAAGDRDRRAPVLDERTEAGELAGAFNLMLDQRDAADDRLRRFASDASHELRTPLTSIRGYLDLYAAGGFRDDGQLDDVVRRMQDESARMNALVDDLLQLARFDEGRSLEPETLDLNRLATDVVANAAAAHPDRALDVIPGPPSGVLVSADPAQITQVISLLVANALTHAPEASVDVVVEQRRDAAVVAVVDDGPGMSSDDAAHVFDRFFRGDGSRSRATGGSGLGLSIAQTIVEAHGGTIELTTAPGDGSRFEVRLPHDRVDGVTTDR